MKTFTFDKVKMTIEPVKDADGQYKLTGWDTNIICTNSFIYDHCDDDKDMFKNLQAMQEAYNLIKKANSVDWSLIALDDYKIKTELN